MNDVTKRSHFEPVELRFSRAAGGEPEVYKIPTEKIFGAIETIEECITLKELTDAVAKSGSVSMTRLARAYASVLRYAGATNVTDEDVYVGMFSNDKGYNGILSAINGLLGLMIPPAAVKLAEKASKEETGKAGESRPAAVRTRAAG